MSSRTKRFFAPWFASVTIGVLLLCFQNCTAAPEFKSATPDPSSKGNGTGYEGKPYYNLDTNSECTNGSLVKSRIELNEEGRGRILRANCVDLNPPQLIEAGEATAQDILGQSGMAVIFKESLFLLEADRTDLPTTSVLLGYCRSYTPTAGPPPPLRMELGIFGIPGAMNAYAVTRSTYIVDQPMLATSVKPPYITGNGTCVADRSYRSDELSGQFYSSASSIIFDHGDLPHSALRVMRSIDPVTSGGIPVTIHTNFFHNFVTPSISSSALACQSAYTNYAVDVQGPAIPARCFLHHKVPGY